jgi:hypothetical protein
LKRGGAGDGEERPAAALAVVQGSWLKVRGDPDGWAPPVSERVREREGSAGAWCWAAWAGSGEGKWAARGGRGGGRARGEG